MASYPGVFCISLDFELHWGCFEHMDLNEAQQQYFLHTREVIPEKLQLFASHNIHVTWATVGMLFHRNATAWKQSRPSPEPTFSRPGVSAYEWIDKHGFRGEEDVFHFAPGLVDKIISTPGQELATHTYAHYFCLEEGQTKEQFRADMETAARLAAERGVQLRSLVFPRNQFKEEYLSVCSDIGITSVRTSPDIWYWSPATHSSFLKKFFRAGDAYLKMQPIRMQYLRDIEVRKDRPLFLPASRLYRPWKPGQPVQNKLKLRRILNEMTEAARKQAYYHIWWHPHNFGNNPRECMNELVQITEHFKRLQARYGMQSMHMQDITEWLMAHSSPNR